MRHLDRWLVPLLALLLFGGVWWLCQLVAVPAWNPNEWRRVMDRELDRLVAENVMGFIPNVGPSGIAYGHENFKEVPSYSTSISDAWLVVEKMKALGWSLQVRQGWNGRNWYTTFNRDADYHLESGEGDTFPESICRAALRAVDGMPRSCSDLEG